MTMNNLIKLSETHYVIVDDSEIKLNDCYIGRETNYATEPKERWVVYYLVSGKPNGINPKKVTHSFGVELSGVINNSLSEL